MRIMLIGGPQDGCERAIPDDHAHRPFEVIDMPSSKLCDPDPGHYTKSAYLPFYFCVTDDKHVNQEVVIFRHQTISVYQAFQLLLQHYKRDPNPEPERKVQKHWIGP